MIVYHVLITAASDYLTRREAHRKAHLDRIIALRSEGFCLGGGPAPDGRTADLFYRLNQPADVTRVVEEDPYFTGGVWASYTATSFSQFLEPWELPPVVIDGSRRVSLVEGRTQDVEMASFALIESRGAGRMAFGGFFPDGQTLALMRTPDPDEAVAALRESGLWNSETLRGRPLLHVL
ncbi:MAG TPA: hypothetical protein VMS64_11445 [Candidatus Methylomirabilis sp.]|nr:hypothetical protein [Candidatus Methylomirabilis sp.]